jgi:hypothetical protein
MSDYEKENLYDDDEELDVIDDEDDEEYETEDCTKTLGDYAERTTPKSSHHNSSQQTPYLRTCRDVGSQKKVEDKTFTYVILSVVSFFICSFLAAIPMFILTYFAHEAYEKGDYDDAERYWLYAKRVFIIAVIIAAVLIIGTFLFSLIFASAVTSAMLM